MYKIPKEIHLCTLTISIDRKRENIHFSVNVICEHSVLCTAHSNNSENPANQTLHLFKFIFLSGRHTVTHHIS